MRKVHFIGVCGVGMSATALLLKESGAEVTGSDAECYGPPKDILAKGGLVPTLHYAPDNIPADADLIVVGRNAKLVSSKNAEVAAAHESGKELRSFPEILGALTNERENVVVIGSYGKSTTTSLIAHILRHGGVDAGYFIGAEPVTSSALPLPAKLGSAPTFVLEGDEYPSSHDDIRAKFMHLHPRDLVLTSVVHDHVNVYPTFEEYQRPFRNILALVPEDGQVVVCADEPGALSLAEASGKTLVTYGLLSGTYQAKDIVVGERTTFTLIKDGEPVANLETNLLGRHNIEDIVAASAYVLTRGLVSPETLSTAVADFRGVRRRLDNLTPASSVPVLEGFGSSYEKARSAIEAMRLHFPTRRLVIVFEPHTFSWRNRASLGWYSDIFNGAEKVFVAAPAKQGAATHDQLSHEEIVEAVRTSGIDVETYSLHFAAQFLSENDVVLVLTSGDLEGTLEDFAKEVTARLPH